MLFASFAFAAMGAGVKLVSPFYATSEIVMYRGLVGTVILFLTIRLRGGSFRTLFPRQHLMRSLLGVTSLWMWFYAIGKLPLATAMTLNYMSSLWVAAFVVGSALLTWRPKAEGDQPALNIPLVLTVISGFCGVILMLRPNIEADQMFAGLVGLMSGLISAFAYMQVVALSRMGEPEQRVVFYFAVGSAIAGGLATLFVGTSSFPGWPALWLIPVGILAAGAQLAMTRAYGSATTRRATLVVANLQYSGIVFAGLFSIVVFGDQIPAIGWMGMALIVGSGIVATVLRKR
jgi:drug/metabolite transporter (DMT)-like permease